MTTPPVGTIPTSSALTEAEPEALQEIMLRDPFDYVRNANLASVVIEAFRLDRQRHAEAERLGKRAKSAKVSPAQATLASPDDLGF